ncbi:hypothetical protein AKJ16_DCAP21309 [Drosera capensis]
MMREKREKMRQLVMDVPMELKQEVKNVFYFQSAVNHSMFCGSSEICSHYHVESMAIMSMPKLRRKTKSFNNKNKN